MPANLTTLPNFLVSSAVSVLANDMGPKQLELLRELVPKASTIAYLRRNTADIEAAARGIGQRVIVINTSMAGEIDTALTEISRQGAGITRGGSRRAVFEPARTACGTRREAQNPGKLLQS